MSTAQSWLLVGEEDSDLVIVLSVADHFTIDVGCQGGQLQFARHRSDFDETHGVGHAVYANEDPKRLTGDDLTRHRGSQGRGGDCRRPRPACPVVELWIIRP
ncbi:hypothetical protein [Amycolatopsis sp. NPDC059657]|uniref:hypothetical protein n=1 Tax=Amycolatopsis sp. NPDC059657 TaxID=3346899 RepID=UPI00366D2E63